MTDLWQNAIGYRFRGCRGGSMKIYTTIQGDMWDSISYKAYGSEKYMGLLMQKNMELLDTFIFGSGTVINVPELEAETETDIPAWR